MADRYFQSRDLSDKTQAGRISRAEIPRHVGGDRGHMRGDIDRGSEHVVNTGTGNQGNLGAEIYTESELPGTNDIQGGGEYGSATVVSLGDLTPAEPELDPGISVTPPPRRTAHQILAEMRQRRN